MIGELRVVSNHHGGKVDALFRFQCLRDMNDTKPNPFQFRSEGLSTDQQHAAGRSQLSGQELRRHMTGHNDLFFRDGKGKRQHLCELCGMVLSTACRAIGDKQYIGALHEQRTVLHAGDAQCPVTGVSVCSRTSRSRA